MSCFMILIHVCILGDFIQINQIVEMGILEILCYNLQLERDIHTLEKIIDGLENIFYCNFCNENFEGALIFFKNSYIKSFEEIGGLESLIKLENEILDQELKEKVGKLHSKYFC